VSEKKQNGEPEQHGQNSEIEDKDVEAHQYAQNAEPQMGQNAEPNQNARQDEGEDVEGHMHGMHGQNAEPNQNARQDDDDVEGHLNA
jgi:hypothetical protein